MPVASDKDLGGLHAKLAQVLAVMLDPVHHAEVLDAEGEVVKPAWTEYPAATVLAVAAKFLKDNSIFSSAEQDENLAALRDKLKKRGRVSDDDVKDAIKGMGANLLQ